MTPTAERVAQRQRITSGIRRTAWMSAGALLAITLTVALLTVRQRSTQAPVEQFVALAAVGIEVLIVLVILSGMTRQIITQATGLEHQSEHLARAVDDAEHSRERAEAMARQKSRLAAILDAALTSAPVGFAFFDDELRFLRVNARLAELNDLAPEEHIGQTVRDVSPSYANRIEPYLVRTLATRESTLNVAAERRDATGSIMYLLSNYYPITMEDGQLLGVGVTVMDVTDRRRLEAQLQQAQKMDAIGRLAGGITHDFNNLLTVIGTSAELIALNRDVHDSLREVDEIRGAVERAAALTRQLLAFSRRQPMSPRIVNPNEVVEGMRELLRRLLLSSVTISTELMDDLHPVRVDPGQLEQVIMNLALNAADAMGNSGTVQISTSNAVLPTPDAPADAAPGDYVRLSVCDTGHGMDAATMEQLFEPFFTTKPPGRGTGLGLATAYGIVRQSGGYIGVTSRPGAGSTFSVYLPAVA